MERGDRLSKGHRPFGRAHPLTDTPDPRPLVPLGEYERPSLPTDQTVRRAWRSLVRTLRPDEHEGPVVERGRLDRATEAKLDRLAAGPATAPAEADLAADLKAWALDPTAEPRLQIIIVPPCAPRDPVDAWARRAGLPCLPPPPRHLLTDDPGPPAPDLSGDGVLVIARLEDWMLRHEDGLDTLRALLAALDETGRRVVVGCGSWAWAFLSKAVDVDLTLPRPRTFAAHDAGRLKAWLSHLSQAARDEGVTFRLASDGSEVFGAQENGEEYFRRLATTSLGIPWVAWHIWRASLRALHPDEETADDSEADDEGLEAARGDVRTIWLVDPSMPTLPKGHERASRLALHALLIHGPLDRALLGLVLPAESSRAVLAALATSGFVDRASEALASAPAAYPEVRRALGNAGLPQDAL